MFNLSIIIPHFNSIDYLRKLLDTIPPKDDIQVIVIDDKSNKRIDDLNSLKKDEKYKKILFLTNTTNKKGAGVCRNIGLNNAEGKWVLFADADDLFIGDFYKHVSEYFSSDYEVVFFKPTSIEIDTGNISDRHIPYENLISNFYKNRNLESEILLRYQFHVPWSKLIKKGFLENNKIYFDEVIASNDMIFSTKVGYYMKKFHVTNETIYCVTRSFGTLTMNMSNEVYDTRLMVFIEYCNFLRSKLTKRELDILDFNGRSIVFNAIRYKLGFKKILSVYVALRKNKIKVLNLNSISLFYNIIKKSYYHHNKYRREKKYFGK